MSLDVSASIFPRSADPSNHSDRACTPAAALCHCLPPNIDGLTLRAYETGLAVAFKNVSAMKSKCFKRLRQVTVYHDAKFMEAEI